MSAFDPDAFLAETAPPAAFDPDAFLAASKPAAPQVGPWETYFNRTAEAIPGGKFLANTGTAAAMQVAKKLFGVGESGVSLSPGAREQAKALGIDIPEQTSAIPGAMDSYRNARGNFTERTAAGSDQNKWAGRAGTATGIGLSLFAPLPKFVPKEGAGALGRIGANAATGTGYGMLNSLLNGKADLTQGQFGQSLKDVVGLEGLQQAKKDWGEGKYGTSLLDVVGSGGIGGGLTGGILSGAMEGVRSTNLLQKAAEALKSFSNRKALNALGAMKPELNELGSEGGQALGQYANDTGIVTPLASRATMAQRIDKLRRAAGGELSSSLGELDAAALPGERMSRAAAAQTVERMASQLDSKPAFGGIADQFRKQAKRILEAPGADSMSLQEFEENIARPYKQITSWSENAALPKKMMQKLPMGLEGYVEQSAGDIAKRTGSNALERYGAAKKDYGNLAELRDIAEEGLRRQASNHSVGMKELGGLATGVSAGLGHGAPGTIALGAAGLVGGKLASRFGDQMSAVGAKNLSSLLGAAPVAGRAGQLAAALEANSPQQMMSLSPQMSDADRLKLQQYADALRGDIQL